MSSHDDPEARIRDLERSLGEQSSELTHSSSETGSGQFDGGYVNSPPPPPYPGQSPYAPPQSPYGVPFPPVPTTSTGGASNGWILYGVLAAVLVAIIGGTVILFSTIFSSVNSAIDTFGGRPSASNGGGGPFGTPPTGGGGNHPSVSITAPSEEVGPPGGDISVAGVGDDKTIACNDSIVNISGVSNTVVLTGQCRSVNVSGVENTVTVDSAATIVASGLNNHVTYLSGAPDVQNSGDSNVVEQG
jgi:hypothetical protein